MTDAEAATRLLNRHARDVAALHDAGRLDDAQALCSIPLREYLELIVEGEYATESEHKR